MNEHLNKSTLTAIEMSPTSNTETSNKAKTKTISMLQEDYDLIYGPFGVKSIIDNVANFLFDSKIKLNDSELLISQFKARLREKNAIMLLGDIELTGENIVEMQKTISEDWDKIRRAHEKITSDSEKKQYALELIASVLINMLGTFKNIFYYLEECDYFDYTAYEIFDGEHHDFTKSYLEDMKNYFSLALVDVFCKHAHPEMSDINQNYFKNMFLAKNKKNIDELFPQFVEKFEEIFIMPHLSIEIEKEDDDYFVLEVHGSDVIKGEFDDLDDVNTLNIKQFIQKYKLEQLIDEPEKIFNFFYNLHPSNHSNEK